MPDAALPGFLGLNDALEAALMRLAERAAAARDVAGNIITGDHVIVAHEGAVVNVGSDVLADHSQKASASLGILALIFARPEIRQSAVKYQTQFSLIQERIDVLIDYKLLHDQLHSIQFQCYEPLLNSAGRLSGDPVDAYELEGYELSLANIVAELISIVEHGRLPPAHISWIADVSEAANQLRTAISESNSAVLYDVIRRLNRILSVQMGRIESYLNVLARTLQLDMLAAAMRQIHDQLQQDYQAEYAQADIVPEGTRSLEALNEALLVLLDTHDAWQGVDIELRRIGAPFVEIDLRRIRRAPRERDPVRENSSIAEGVQEIKRTWPRVDEQILALAMSNESLPFKRLRERHAKMRAAIETDDPVEIARQYRYLHHQAAFCFFCVDKQVKTLCEELRKIGAPLSSLTGILE